MSNEKDDEMKEIGADEAAPQIAKISEKSDKKKVKKKKEDPAIEAKKELLKTQEELRVSQEQFLRIRAEYDNFRKRSIAEKDSIYNSALTDVIQTILPVADNMERALAQENGKEDDLKKGLQMIYQQIQNSFEQLEVNETGKVGEVFDPNLHNAVSHIEDENASENSIATVMQKGYVRGDRVIRHAMVQVAN